MSIASLLLLRLADAFQVHIQDLAELNELVLLDMVHNDEKNLPFGEKGIIFSGNGRHTWRQMAQGAVDAAFQAEEIEFNTVRSVSLRCQHDHWS